MHLDLSDAFRGFIQREIAVGLAQLDAGETERFTPALRCALKKAARRMAKAGGKPKTTAVP